jgi:hypothetical protein
MTDIPKAARFELNSLDELIRLVVASSQNRGGHIYYGEKNGEHILLVTHLVPSWFELKGLPITMFAKVSEAPTGKFIAYSYTNNDDNMESWEFVDYIRDNPKIAHIPIIKVKEFPDYVF